MNSSDRTWMKLLWVGVTALAIAAAPYGCWRTRNRTGGNSTGRSAGRKQLIMPWMGSAPQPAVGEAILLCLRQHPSQKANLYSTDSPSGAASTLPPMPDVQYP